MTLKLCPDGTHDERTNAALAAAHDLADPISVSRARPFLGGVVVGTLMEGQTA